MDNEESIINVRDWVSEVPGSLAGKSPEELHLIGSRCDRCGQAYFPSRRNCPNCLDDHPVEQIQLNDTGILQTFVVANVAPPGYSVPHAQGYIHLSDDGPLLFSLLVDYGEASNLKIGCEMALKIVESGRDKADRLVLGYRFRPLKQGE